MLGFVNTPGLRISNDSSSELSDYQDILLDCEDGSQVKTIKSVLLISGSDSGTKSIKPSYTDITEGATEPVTEDSRMSLWVKLPES